MIMSQVNFDLKSDFVGLRKDCEERYQIGGYHI